MSHVSRNELDSKTKYQIINTFELVLGKMDKDEANTFFYSILSDTERVMVAKRLAIALLLKEGIDESAIARALNVTRETVDRINLVLLKRPQGYGLAIKKINEDKMMQELKKTLVKLASYSIKAAGGRVNF
jgi:uncharacterized protein YerC